jgi:hypothetical protein
MTCFSTIKRVTSKWRQKQLAPVPNPSASLRHPACPVQSTTRPLPLHPLWHHHQHVLLTTRQYQRHVLSRLSAQSTTRLARLGRPSSHPGPALRLRHPHMTLLLQSLPITMRISRPRGRRLPSRAVRPPTRALKTRNGCTRPRPSSSPRWRASSTIHRHPT